MKANSTHLSSKGNRKNLTAKKKKSVFKHSVFLYLLMWFRVKSLVFPKCNFLILKALADKITSQHRFYCRKKKRGMVVRTVLHPSSHVLPLGSLVDPSITLESESWTREGRRKCCSTLYEILLLFFFLFCHHHHYLHQLHQLHPAVQGMKIIQSNTVALLQDR